MERRVRESSVRRRIIEALERRGWLVVPVPASALGVRGVSDVIVCADGLFVAVEIKAPGGALSPHQRRWGDKVLSCGGTYIVSSSPQEVVDAIDSRLAAYRSRL